MPHHYNTGEDYLDHEKKKKKKKKPSLWETMKKDTMKGKTSKKKAKTIQDILKEMNQ